MKKIHNLFPKKINDVREYLKDEPRCPICLHVEETPGCACIDKRCVCSAQNR